MSYTALYRKFRPKVFSEVKGQDAIVTTLKNQIKSDRIGHAYLFCGTRGTGKTSVAKIFARAVNCENPKDGSPCGECAVCRAIEEGRSLNVVEMDAASNNGIDTIREIRDQVTYAPTEGKYLVYIVDEVHNLSSNAFNALLKTLEEPPSYIIFILATTDVQQLPDTILSRCQRYDFRRIEVSTIAARLSELLEREGVAAEERAVRYIARLADGSMRDAISLLDQAIAFNLGEELTYDRVLVSLGAVDTELFSKLFRLIRSEDTAGALKLLDEVVIRGREIPQFVNDFLWYLRNLLLLKSTDDLGELLDVSSENEKSMKEEADMAPYEVLMRYIRVLSALSSDLRHSSQKRILAEVALIRLMKPEMEQDLSSVLDRLDRLERRIEHGMIVQRPNTPPPGGEAEAETAKSKEPPKTPKKKVDPKTLSEEIKEVVKRWDEVVSILGPGPDQKFLSKAKLSVSGGSNLLIVLQNTLAFDYCSTPEEEEQIRQAITEVTGLEVEIQLRALDSQTEAEPDLKEVLSEKINLPIEEET